MMPTLRLLAEANHTLTGQSEQKRLRLRLFTVPAAVARTGRRVLLHLAEKAPWAQLVADARQRPRVIGVSG
jgi:hypothetical protein